MRSKGFKMVSRKDIYEIGIWIDPATRSIANRSSRTNKHNDREVLEVFEDIVKIRVPKATGFGLEREERIEYKLIDEFRIQILKVGLVKDLKC